MSHAFLSIATTPAVKAVQAAHGSRRGYARLEDGPSTHDRLGSPEAAFVAERDSFYLATVSSAGWPYLQHRGGRPGFLKVLDPHTLAMADLRGNRQYLSLGNLAGDSRAALLLMDYQARRRLKLFVRVAVHDPQAAGVPKDLDMTGAERALVFHVEAFDWNCPQHITPRFTEDEVARAIAPLRQRLATLEAENAALRRTASQGARP